jgi:RimJ/RimL family protein N-acetyltransferase
MKQQPILETERLTLRPFRPDDASRIQELAGDKDIASTTIEIPHPYRLEDGLSWISTHQKQFNEGCQIIYAATLTGTGELVGAIDLRIEKVHKRAEMGYWVGKPYWNRGYWLGLNRIHARHFVRNPASEKVLQKTGMKYEGTLGQYFIKWGKFEDVKLYAILKDDWSL